MMWMDAVQKHHPDAAITVLAVRALPESLGRHFASFGNVRIVIGPYAPDARVLRTPHATHNVFFKLFQLSRLDEPAIYLDADAVVLSSLEPLWALRLEKPWIGINHQLNIPGHTGARPFLNSGVQVIGEPSFYDYDRILACARAHAFTFDVPGSDQACLWTYFRDIGYDYTHPAAGAEWNACAGFVDLTPEQDGRWRGQVRGLTPVHEVFVNHYWRRFKPWLIDCPIYATTLARYGGGACRGGP
jgi:hypothetical protein